MRFHISLKECALIARAQSLRVILAHPQPPKKTHQSHRDCNGPYLYAHALVFAVMDPISLCYEYQAALRQVLSHKIFLVQVRKSLAESLESTVGNSTEKVWWWCACAMAIAVPSTYDSTYSWISSQQWSTDELGYPVPHELQHMSRCETSRLP